MLSCHQLTHNRGGKKHLSFSTAIKTVTQNYKTGHIITSQTFSTFMGDEGAKSIQECVVTYRRNLN